MFVFGVVVGSGKKVKNGWLCLIVNVVVLLSMLCRIVVLCGGSDLGCLNMNMWFYVGCYVGLCR